MVFNIKEDVSQWITIITFFTTEIVLLRLRVLNKKDDYKYIFNIKNPGLSNYADIKDIKISLPLFLIGVFIAINRGENKFSMDIIFKLLMLISCAVILGAIIHGYVYCTRVLKKK